MDEPAGFPVAMEGLEGRFRSALVPPGFAELDFDTPVEGEFGRLEVFLGTLETELGFDGVLCGLAVD